MVRIIGQKIIGQDGHANSGGDRIAVTYDRKGRITHIAAIDGVAPKTLQLFDGRPGDIAAAETVAASCQKLREGMSTEIILDHLSRDFNRDVIQHYGIDMNTMEDYPAAHAVIWARNGGDGHGRIIVVGDGNYHYHYPDKHHQEPHYTTKAIDTALARLRVATNREIIRRGLRTEQQLGQNDLGRKVIYECLRLQFLHRNSKDQDNPFAFAVIDGQDIPHHLVHEQIVENQPGTIVTLSTDGILQFVRKRNGRVSLKQSFTHTAAYVAHDPIRKGEFPGTSGTSPDNPKPADRAMIQFRL